MSIVPFAATTPVHVSKVGLAARDAETVAEYYRDVIGLADLSRRGGTIVLGAGDQPLLEIAEDKALRPDDTRQAGLFHTAFLLPQRSDLARWARRAMERHVRIDGASDHLVSEAIYLSDPEGNGIEIYADRPREDWPFEGSQVKMATLPLDFKNLIATISNEDAGWNGAPEGSVVGHVHLRVGDPAEAELWWREEMGFDTMARYGGKAVFLSSGGYHHHIGANAWQSASAGLRDPGRAGLAWVELAAREAGHAGVKTDPWGNEIRIAPAKA